jgi:hypothetical protein
MSVKSIVKVVCLAIIAIPNLVAATQGIEIPPVGNLAIAMLGTVAGLVMGEIEPGYDGKGE